MEKSVSPEAEILFFTYLFTLDIPWLKLFSSTESNLYTRTLDSVSLDSYTVAQNADCSLNIAKCIISF
jgi:hypothetical protein